MLASASFGEGATITVATANRTLKCDGAGNLADPATKVNDPGDMTGVCSRSRYPQNDHVVVNRISRGATKSYRL